MDRPRSGAPNQVNVKRVPPPRRGSTPAQPPQGLRGRVIIDARVPGDNRDADAFGRASASTNTTTYPENGNTIGQTQLIAGRRSPQTTNLYGRNADTVTITTIEKIP